MGHDEAISWNCCIAKIVAVILTIISRTVIEKSRFSLDDALMLLAMVTHARQYITTRKC